MMPKLNGFAMLTKLRKTHDTPVLMLTARGDSQDRVNGLEAGADDYLGQRSMTGNCWPGHAPSCAVPRAPRPSAQLLRRRALRISCCNPACSRPAAANSCWS